MLRLKNCIDGVSESPAEAQGRLDVVFELDGSGTVYGQFLRFPFAVDKGFVFHLACSLSLQADAKFCAYEQAFVDVEVDAGKYGGVESPVSPVGDVAQQVVERFFSGQFGDSPVVELAFHFFIVGIVERNVCRGKMTRESEAASCVEVDALVHVEMAFVAQINGKVRQIVFEDKCFRFVLGVAVRLHVAHSKSQLEAQRIVVGQEVSEFQSVERERFSILVKRVELDFGAECVGFRDVDVLSRDGCGT